MQRCQNPECNKEFNPSNQFSHNQKYCSRRCSKRADYIKNGKLYPSYNHRLHPQIGRIQKYQRQISLEIEAKLRALAERQQDANGFFIIASKCEVCGSTENLLRHEISYSPLETVTLCASCHGILHHRFLKDKRVKPRPKKIFPLMVRSC